MNIVGNVFILASLPSLFFIFDLNTIRFPGSNIHMIIQAFLQMTIIFNLAQRPTTEMKKLVWHLRFNIQIWNEINLLCLLRIERLAKDFATIIYSLVSIRHTIYVAIIALILNYLLLLIQIGALVNESANQEKDDDVLQYI